MIASVIADNFRSRVISSSRRGSGGAYRLKFFGYDEDAEICINIFNYAVKVIRNRFATLRAIYADAGREFGRNEKMNYVEGFCYGLERNFEDQKAQSESFTLALIVPPAGNMNQTRNTRFFGRRAILTGRIFRTPATKKESQTKNGKVVE